MASPICLVNNTLPVSGFTASASSTITIAVQDTAGITQWAISCVYTDGYDSPASINATANIDPLSKTATFTVPAHACGLIFRSVVNNGINRNQQPDNSLTHEFKIKVLTNRGVELIADNENTQGNAAGWGRAFNNALRLLDQYQPFDIGTGSNGEVQVKTSLGITSATNVVAGSGFISIGSSPAGTGALRVPYNSGTIIGAKNNLGSDVSVLSGGAGYTLGNSTQVLTIDGSTLTLKVAGSNVLTATSTTVNIPGALSLGSNAASAGAIRLPNAGAIIGRNQVNSVDIPMMNLDAANNLYLGDQTYTNAARLWGSVSAGLAVNGNAQYVLVESSGLFSLYGVDAVFDTAKSSPKIYQAANTTNGATAQSLSLNAQNATGTGTTTGGNLLLSAGSGTTNGVVRLCVNGTTGVQITPSSNGQNIYNVAAGATSVLFNQTTTNSGSGAAMTIQAQNSGAASSLGGSLTLTSGTGTTAPGATRIQLAGNTMIETAQVVSGNNIVALARKSNITSTQMGASTGDGVVYVANAATNPSANPASGAILYADGGILKVRQSDGFASSLASDPTINGLRLTLASGTPVITSDVASSSTVYLTPHTSGFISLYDGTGWVLKRTNEISISLSSLTSGKNYDVFAYINSGNVALELSAAWSTDATRTDALVRQDGIWVKSGATTRRYLGTFRTISTTTTTDTQSQRFLYNWSNQTVRALYVQDATATWTYNSATFRQVRGQTASKVELVIGQPAQVEASSFLMWNGASGTGVALWTGIGIDSTSTNSAQSMGILMWTMPAQYWNPSQSDLDTTLTTGFHTLYWLEASYSGGLTGMGSVGNAIAHMRAKLLM